jgi:hypothetical protein
MGDPYKWIKEIVHRLHEHLYIQYKSKYHFCFELFLRKGDLSLVLILPSYTYSQLPADLFKDIKVEVVNDHRDKFFENLSENTIGIDCELSKDFVFPLVINKETKLQSLLQDQEWIFLQLVLRPASPRWLASLDKYTQRLEKGKPDLDRFNGCMGGCMQVVLPFLTVLGDILTSLIHGSKEQKQAEDESKQPLDEKKRKHIESVKKKRNSMGFETALRIMVSDHTKDRAYELLDQIANWFFNKEEFTNSFIFSNVLKKLEKGFKYNIFLSYIDKDTLDIMSAKEVDGLFKKLI